MSAFLAQTFAGPSLPIALGGLIGNSIEERFTVANPIFTIAVISDRLKAIPDSRTYPVCAQFLILTVSRQYIL